MYGVPIPLCKEINVETNHNNDNDNNDNDNNNDNGDNDDDGGGGYGDEFSLLLAAKKAELADKDPNEIDI